MDGETWGYLNGRGLADDTIQTARLGLILPGKEEKYVKRDTWGLEKKFQDNGREKDLWIPAGNSHSLLHKWQGGPAADTAA